VFVYYTTSCTRPRDAVAQSHPVLSCPVPSHPIPDIKTFGDCFRLHRFLARYRCPYISKNTRVFEFNVVSKFESNRRTFGDCSRLHRFLARYRCPIYIYIYQHARIRLQRCVKISKQSVKNFPSFEVRYKRTVTFLFI
jgi:hypothetical protein